MLTFLYPFPCSGGQDGREHGGASRPEPPAGAGPDGAAQRPAADAPVHEGLRGTQRLDPGEAHPSPSWAMGTRPVELKITYMRSKPKRSEIFFSSNNQCFLLAEFGHDDASL